MSYPSCNEESWMYELCKLVLISPCVLWCTGTQYVRVLSSCPSINYSEMCKPLHMLTLWHHERQNFEVTTAFLQGADPTKQSKANTQSQEWGSLEPMKSIYRAMYMCNNNIKGLDICLRATCGSGCPQKTSIAINAIIGKCRQRRKHQATHMTLGGKQCYWIRPLLAKYLIYWII